MTTLWGRLCWKCDLDNLGPISKLYGGLGIWNFSHCLLLMSIVFRKNWLFETQVCVCTYIRGNYAACEKWVEVILASMLSYVLCGGEVQQEGKTAVLMAGRLRPQRALSGRSRQLFIRPVSFDINRSIAHNVSAGCVTWLLCPGFGHQWSFCSSRG